MQLSYFSLHGRICGRCTWLSTTARPSLRAIQLLYLGCARSHLWSMHKIISLVSEATTARPSLRAIQLLYSGCARSHLWSMHKGIPQQHAHDCERCSCHTFACTVALAVDAQRYFMTARPPLRAMQLLYLVYARSHLWSMHKSIS